MPRHVHLHVGAPKSGTTYLQSRLQANRRSLGRHGLHYPLGALADPRTQYWAALDVTGTDHGVPVRRVRGAWGRLLRQVRRTSGDVVLSHEVLARATRDQAARVLDDLASTGAEVRIVLTARDLGRELTSGWQETLKFGGRATYARYLAGAREGRSAFMAGFDPVRVLTTWARDLPGERVHVVTAPPPGAAPDLLWHRFLDAIGADAAWAPREATLANESVGVPEAQLLRRLNRRLGQDARRGGELSGLVDGVVVREALAPRDSPRITLGPDDHPWVAARSDEWIRWLGERGVRVHGDLEDLRPAPPGDDWVDPDAPLPRQVTAAALDVAEVLLAEAHHGRTRHPVRRLLARLR
ncbi:hypothetical protein [Isoptericola sp. BMS4]|uniref:hypothetical protein n=1 Tax=Isoptericola sp. BMS4 TaxID=2527875 RepID=UPI00142110E8|nr:hypothetical protein [Isoptericola sp. BMS4]